MTIRAEVTKKHMLWPKIAGAIIVTSSHARYLSDVLQDCLNQTLPFSEIHIVASGLAETELRVLRQQVFDTRNEAIMIHEVPAGSAGRNRNIALKSVSQESEYLIFHDADDRYSRFRNEIIVGHFDLDVDLLIHCSVTALEHSKEESVLTLNVYRPTVELVLNSGEIMLFNPVDHERHRRWEASGALPTGLVAPLQEDLILHHGHVAIQFPRRFGFRYHEKFFPRNEDSLLIRDVIAAGKKVRVIVVPLSVYVLGTTATRKKLSLNRIEYKALKTIHLSEIFFRKQIRHLKRILKTSRLSP